MFRKIVDNFFIISINIFIVIAAILVGSPLKYNLDLFFVIVAIFSIVNIILYNLIFKEKLIKRKLDIYIILSSFISFLPLIFKTYTSLNQTVNGIFKYILVLAFFIMFNNTLSSNKNMKKSFIITLIFSSFCICVIGIDDFSFKFLSKYIDKILDYNIVVVENTMVANFKYTNTFAMVIFSSSLLLFDFIKNESENNIKNNLKNGIIFALNLIFVSMGILAEAYIVTFLYLVALLIILCLGKENIRKNILLIINSLFLAVLLDYFFIKMVNNNKNINALIIILTLMGFSFSVGFLLNSIIPYLNKIKIKLKYLILFIIAVTILGISFILIGMQFKAPLEIFNENSSNSDVRYKIKNIEGNKKYKLEFDIDSKIKYGGYRILIEEENEYYDIVKSRMISIYNGYKKAECEFITTNDTIELGITFISKNKDAQSGLKINKLLVNEKEFPLNYKFLPANLINKIVSSLIQNRSVLDRLSHYRDGFKIGQEHFLVGSGEGTWKNKIPEYESYYQSAKEAHSYPINLFINYGILQVILYIFILINLIRILIKKIKLNGIKSLDLGLVLVITILTIDNLLDFNMSFFYVNLIYYLMILVLVNDENEKNKNNFLDYIMIGLIIISLIVGTYFNYNQVKFSYLYKTNNSKELLKKYKEKLPYNREILAELIQVNNNKELILELLKKEPYFGKFYIKELSKLELTKDELDFIYNNLKEWKISISILKLQERNEIILKMAENSKDIKYKNKFYDILINEYEENSYSKIFSSIKENRLNYKYFNEIKMKIDECYETAKLAKENIWN